MKTTFRQVQRNDLPVVLSLVEAAFRRSKTQGKHERQLVERVQNSEEYVPELAFVAESEGKIVGHIIFAKAEIIENEQHFPTLSMILMSTAPDFQHRGIGAQLVRMAHKEAIGLGFGSVVLLGHANYYPRFGYKRASLFGIKLPFETADENCMALELIPGGLDDITGNVQYPSAYFG